MAVNVNVNVTKVGIVATRLPAAMRTRLMGLSQRGYQVCTKHGASLLAQICDGLALALVELSATELRARDTERLLGEARVRIAMLERELEARTRAEFDEPTVTRSDNPYLVAQSARTTP